MPTIAGLRRRGYTPKSIIDFIGRIGVAKSDSLVDIALLEHCIRDELNFSAPRRIAVLEPLKLVIDNYPEDKTEYFEISNNPNDETAGTRKLAFTRELYIERSDFLKEKAPKFFRLYPDNEVRLMSAYVVKCTGFEEDENGNVTVVHGEVDFATAGQNPPDGRKIKGTIHWVSAQNCITSDVIKYDRLFTEENMTSLPEGKEYADFLNPDSAVRLTGCRLEKSLEDSRPGDKYQFVRNGYYCRDTKDLSVFNLIVGLKESKQKQQTK